MTRVTKHAQNTHARAHAHTHISHTIKYLPLFASLRTRRRSARLLRFCLVVFFVYVDTSFWIIHTLRRARPSVTKVVDEKKKEEHSVDTNVLRSNDIDVVALFVIVVVEHESVIEGPSGSRTRRMSNCDVIFPATTTKATTVRCVQKTNRQSRTKLFYDDALENQFRRPDKRIPRRAFRRPR